MSRRARLPGAAELFRGTGPGDGLEGAADESSAGVPVRAVPDLPGDPAAATAAPDAPSATRSSSGVRQTAPRRGHTADRRPSGRERHDEKFTVYVSADELYDLEQARLVLRGSYGLAVDRGRIVREALSLVIADLDLKGESSILVRRLREG